MTVAATAASQQAIVCCSHVGFLCAALGSCRLRPLCCGVLWYVVCCRIVYLPGLEEEDLNLDDIIRDGHMMLMPPRRP